MEQKWKIDKVGIRIKKRDLHRSNQNIFNPHIHIKYFFDEIFITWSSRAYLKANTIPAITINNIKCFSEIISISSGYEVQAEYLLHSPLSWIDVNRDIINDTSYTNAEVISILKEKSYKSTVKTEILSYENKLGFENSIVVKPSCKTIRDSFCIYDKAEEIKSCKNKEKDFYNNFSTEFLENNKNLLRFERRMQSSKDIKKAFHLEHLKTITLADIFNCECDVVTEKVKKLYL